MDLNSRHWRVLFFYSVVVTAFFTGCSDNGQSKSLTGNSIRLYAEGQRILGFENHNDWSNTSANSTEHTEGAQSIKVVAGNWVKVESIPMVSLGIPLDKVSVDVRLPVMPSWGDMTIVVKVPSRNIYYEQLETVSMSTLTPGIFNTVSFIIPQHVADALSGTYSDLQLTVVLNSAPMTQPILVDNMHIVEISDEDPPTVITDSVERDFIFTLPSEVALENAFLTSSDSLRISNAVSVNNENATVSNMGTGDVVMNTDVTLEGDVHAMGNVSLADRVHIGGFLRADGTVDMQNDVIIDDGVQETPVALGKVVQWTTQWPAPAESLTVAKNQIKDMSPGSYGEFRVQPNGTLILNPGTYYLNALIVEQSGTVIVKGDGDPVVLFVKDTLESRGAISHSTSSEDFLIAFGGYGVADLDAPFGGTVIAPNATVRLAPVNGAIHEGAFVGKTIDVEANNVIDFKPFAHWNSLLEMDACTPAGKYFDCTGLSAWEQKVYDIGDEVTDGVRVYRVHADASRTLAGTSPEFSPNTGTRWQEAWKVVGECDEDGSQQAMLNEIDPKNIAFMFSFDRIFEENSQRFVSGGGDLEAEIVGNDFAMRHNATRQGCVKDSALAINTALTEAATSPSEATAVEFHRQLNASTLAVFMYLKTHSNMSQTFISHTTSSGTNLAIGYSEAQGLYTQIGESDIHYVGKDRSKDFTKEDWHYIGVVVADNNDGTSSIQMALDGKPLYGADNEDSIVVNSTLKTADEQSDWVIGAGKDTTFDKFQTPLIGEMGAVMAVENPWTRLRKLFDDMMRRIVKATQALISMMNHLESVSKWSNNIRSEHPRLFLLETRPEPGEGDTVGEVDNRRYASDLRAALGNTPYEIRGIHDHIVTSCDGILNDNEYHPSYTPDLSGVRINHHSHAVLRRLFYLSYCIRIDENNDHWSDWIEKAQTELDLVTRSCGENSKAESKCDFDDYRADYDNPACKPHDCFPAWVAPSDKSGFLDAAYMAMGVAIAYDWLFNVKDKVGNSVLDEPLKIQIRHAIRRRLFSLTDEKSKIVRSPYRRIDNQNPSNNAALILSALALYGDGANDVDENDEDEGSSYTNDGALLSLIARSFHDNALGLNAYYAVTDGTPTEGPMYWDAAITAQNMIFAAIESAVGFDLVDPHNFESTADNSDALSVIPDFYEKYDDKDGTEPDALFDQDQDFKYGLMKGALPGLFKSAIYLLYSRGTSGLMFSYADSRDALDTPPILFWFANKFPTSADFSALGDDYANMEENRSRLLGILDLDRNTIMHGIANSKGLHISSDMNLPLAMIYGYDFSFDSTDTNASLQSWVGGGLAQVAMFRTHWTGRSGKYLGIKGGLPCATGHSDMDTGSFVYDDNGYRWAMDYGKQDYDVAEAGGFIDPYRVIFGTPIRVVTDLSEVEQDYIDSDLSDGIKTLSRWDMFRKHNRSHNTLSLCSTPGCTADNDPMQHKYPKHDEQPYCRIEDRPAMTALGEVGAKIRLTETLNRKLNGTTNELQKAVRYIYIEDNARMRITDYITAGAEDAYLYWNMVTPAQTELVDNYTIRLTQGLRSMLLKFSPQNVTDFKADANRSNTPRYFFEDSNEGTTMVGYTATVEAGKEAIIDVILEETAPPAYYFPVLSDMVLHRISDNGGPIIVNE